MRRNPDIKSGPSRISGSLQFGVLIVCALFLINCNGSSAPTGDTAVTEEQQNEAPGQLTIYSGRSETLVDTIIKRFGDQTGIEISVKYAKTPLLAATLLEEGAKTPADIFFAQDVGGLGAVSGMLAPLPSGITNKVPEWARSVESDWVGISGRARVVVYHTKTLNEKDLPDDVWNFIEPEWEGRIGWAPSNASFQTMVTAMLVDWGEEKTSQWLEGIKANDPKVYPKNTPIVAAVGAGEVDVGFVNHYYLYRFLAEEGDSFTARNYYPREAGPGGVMLVSAAGILKTSENKSEAEQFIEFLLSTEGQSYFVNQTFEYPLVGISKSDVELIIPLSVIDLAKQAVHQSALSDVSSTVKILQDLEIL